jgi:hypothetical protein
MLRQRLVPGLFPTRRSHSGQGHPALPLEGLARRCELLSQALAFLDGVDARKIQGIDGLEGEASGLQRQRQGPSVYPCRSLTSGQ